MSLKPYLPTMPQLTRETIVALASMLLAALILSRFPKLQQFVASNSITVRDGNGTTLF